MNTRREVYTKGDAPELIAHSLSSRTTTTPALHSNDLVIESTQVQSKRRPSLEVILDGDSTTGSIGRSDRDILIESRRALDRRLVNTRVLIDRIA